MKDSDNHMDESLPDDLHEITLMLRKLDKNKSNTDALIPLVYNHLRNIASRQMFFEMDGQTLQPTALVHESYLRLIKSKTTFWENRRHFLAAASKAMRRILIESARSKKTLKRGGGAIRSAADPGELPVVEMPVDILDLEEALKELEMLDPHAAELVQLRYFVGLSMKQIGDILDVSERKASGIWEFAQAWLYRRLKH